MNQLTETQKAYIAGLFDGEGSIVITYREQSNGSRSVYWHMRINNTFYALHEWLMEALGAGRIVRTTGQVYAWYMSSHVDIIKLLRVLYPYLIIKKEQADICFEFDKTYSHEDVHIGAEGRAKRYELLAKLSLSKRSGRKEKDE